MKYTIKMFLKEIETNKEFIETINVENNIDPKTYSEQLVAQYNFFSNTIKRKLIKIEVSF